MVLDGARSNLSIMKALQLGIGDTIQVYKANMIIPQIADNLTRSGNMEIPQTCPVCGGVTRIQRTADVETLYCTNPECQAKKIKSFCTVCQQRCDEYGRNVGSDSGKIYRKRIYP